MALIPAGQQISPKKSIDFFLLYVTKFVDLWNGRGSSSFLLSLRRKGGRDDRAEAHRQPIEPQ
jgi:hypothetical protein